MERAKYFIISILCVCWFSSIKADNKTEIYNAYLSNNMVKWKTIIDKMNLEKKKSNDFILELINYQYGYIAWCIGNKKEDDAETYLELAEKNVEYLEKQSYKLSYINSYKSALYGFELGLAWYKAPFIGPKSVDCAEKAMKLDKANPYGFLQYANAQYYMPETFGGSKTVAIDYYKKAQILMEKNSDDIISDWNYLSLLTIIANAYTETKKYTLAKEYYDKILKIEPEFLWVKNELYPVILKKIKK